LDIRLQVLHLDIAHQVQKARKAVVVSLKALPLVLRHLLNILLHQVLQVLLDILRLHQVLLVHQVLLPWNIHHLQALLQVLR